MKKFLMFFIALTMLCGCSKPVEEPSAKVAYDKITQKEDMIVVISSTTCSSCKKFATTLDQFIERYPEVPIQKVIIEDEQFTEIDGEKKREYFTKLDEIFGKISGTPFIAFMKNGEVQYQYAGLMEYTAFKSKAIECGFIEE